MKNFDNIPNELQELPQWVCNRVGDKIPMQANRPLAASSTNSQTWCSFTDAVRAVSNGTYDYLGFVFADNGIVGIDIDAGYEGIFLSEISTDIIKNCNSYTERSKSGRGFHILLKGDLPFKGKNNLKGVEIYKTSRYFVTTGDVFLDYNHIIENQKAIDYVVSKYFPETREETHHAIAPKIYCPQWDMPTDRIPLRPNYPEIPDGCRNISLTSLAGTLHNSGYDYQHILKELRYCNKSICKPPLPDWEVKTIAKSICRYSKED